MEPAPRADSVHGPIDCETAVRRLWDYLDGRLTTMSRREVELHLESCAGCPPHFTFARAMKQALAAAPRPVAEGDEARLRERVREALGRMAMADATPESGETGIICDEER
jgi:anti-sigma factor RsiW